MKKLVVFIVTILAFTGIATAGNIIAKEPVGFGAAPFVKFGDKLPDKMFLVKVEDNRKVYTSGDPATLYVFKDNKLSGGIVKVDSERQMLEMRESRVLQYGSYDVTKFAANTPYGDDVMEYIWDFPKVKIVLTWDRKTTKGQFTYTYKPLERR